MEISRKELLRNGAAAAMAGTLPGLVGPIQDAGARATGPGHPQRPPAGEGLCLLSAIELRDLMRARRVSPVEVMEAHLARIERLNPALNAFVALLPDTALAGARAAERRIMRGGARPLEGLPVAIKDLFDFLAGAPNTFGSVPMKQLGFTPDHSSIYVQRLIDAGAIPIGKTNTPEFGHEGITDNFAWGPTHNPFDHAFNSGGSSGGSAAATAGFLTPLSQGSDAGGSVRIPAAFCGVVGFKPTQGRIPQDAPPLSHTPFFTPGPITRTVGDTALMMDAMGQPWSGDPLSLSEPMDYQRTLDRGIRGKRIAFSPALDLFPVEAEVERVVRSALDGLRAAGAHVEEVSLGLDALTVDGRTVQLDDLSSLWVQEQSVLYAHGYDLFRSAGVIDLLEHRSDLSPEFAGMIDLGLATSAMQYRHGDFLRIGVLGAIEQVLASYDFIVSPTLSVLGVANDTNGNTLGPAQVDGVPVDRLIGWCLTYPFNFSGHPAISVPAGMGKRGAGAPPLPVGLQIVGRRWADLDVLAAARAFERQRPWSATYPR